VINHLGCVNIPHSVTAVEPGFRQTFSITPSPWRALRRADCQTPGHIHENPILRFPKRFFTSSIVILFFRTGRPSQHRNFRSDSPLRVAPEIGKRFCKLWKNDTSHRWSVDCSKYGTVIFTIGGWSNARSVGEDGFLKAHRFADTIHLRCRICFLPGAVGFWEDERTCLKAAPPSPDLNGEALQSISHA
jgi:hypothetical protein